MVRYVVVVCALAHLGFTQPVREAERYQVIIVGAGVSGFTAAATLLEHNVSDLIVLEASDRIGGRIHTVEFGGVPIDKGAEFVHGENDNAVYEMVSSYDLLTSYMPLLDPEYALVVNTSGDVFNSSYVIDIIKQTYAILEESGIKNVSGSMADYFYPRLRELITSKCIEPQLAEAIRHLVIQISGTQTAADDFAQLGAQGWKEYWYNEGDDTLKWKTGGYKTIFNFLSKKFPNPKEELPVLNRTTFGKQVEQIETKGEELWVKCIDGSTYIADHVIVTVSLGVLKKHAAAMFHPPLPTEKMNAIETINIGCVGKVFLLFPNRWWPNDTNVIVPLFFPQELQDFQTNSTYGSWTSYVTGFYPVINHNRMLCVWVAGQACRTMESLTEEQVVDGLMELLNNILGKAYDIPKPESILRSGWGSYPYTLGSYSYRTVASDRLNLTNCHLAQPILDGNKPLILFAGEATHPHYYSTVHGALSTGRREAHNLINYFNNHPHYQSS